MATVWHGVVNPPRTGAIRAWDCAGDAVTLAQGAEMGRFLLGSTVVLLFPKGTLQFDGAWRAEKPVRMGEAMAEAKAGPGG
jgi:phosphatidylserine decarboxylase